MPAVVLVVEGDTAADVFEVVSADDNLIRVRAAFRFERGEELALRVDGAEVAARVRGCVDGVTELEVLPP